MTEVEGKWTKGPDLQALLLRVGASGPDRALFLALAQAIVPDYADALDWRETFNAFIGVGAWESAALSLVERVLPGGRAMTERNFDGSGWAMVQAAPSSMRAMADGPTPAMALLAALLMALIARQPDQTLSGSQHTKTQKERRR